MTDRKQFLSIRNIVANFFCFVVPGVTLALIIVFTLSPLAFSYFAMWADGAERAPAAIESCELVRDGSKARHAIRCAALYAYEGKQQQAVIDVWTSTSPFATLSSLHRELAQQRTITSREVVFSKRYPQYPSVMDDRVIAMPGLPALLIVLLCMLFGAAIHGASRSRMHRRADYVLDPATDRLVPINANRARRARHQKLRWSLALGVAMLACVYGLSSRLPKEISMLALPGLQSHTAQLVACKHKYYGTRKGHDQIDCQFRYDVNGRVHTGQAESLDFRFFPTDARMDARVALLEGRTVTAWVDPAQPTYAWALIEPDWFVPYSFGLFEWMLLILLVGVLPVALVVVLRTSACKGRDH
ncbi:MAG: hypothetical protein EON54_04535 [Alcaligenaceae bacterium]|nr:MAG: hypothetical protein EON54_04535 [Alcaligenaceae bacterium]